MIPQLYKCFNRWCAAGTVWIYSDPHFNDSERKKYKRLSDEEQVIRINSKVGKKDTIIFLGDIGDTSFIRRIKGYKVLVMGNHDQGRTNYERQIIKTYFDKMNFSKEEALNIVKNSYPDWSISWAEEYNLTHAPFEYWLITADNRLFDEVYEGVLAIGEKLILSHEPIDFPFVLNLHGHCHNGQQNPHHINCCSNVVNYTPLNLNQICKSGALSKIETIHRATIDEATQRKIKREKKKNKN